MLAAACVKRWAPTDQRNRHSLEHVASTVGSPAVVHDPCAGIGKPRIESGIGLTPDALRCLWEWVAGLLADVEDLLHGREDHLAIGPVTP